MARDRKIHLGVHEDAVEGSKLLAHLGKHTEEAASGRRSSAPLL